MTLDHTYLKLALVNIHPAVLFNKHSGSTKLQILPSSAHSISLFVSGFHLLLYWEREFWAHLGRASDQLQEIILKCNLDDLKILYSCSHPKSTDLDNGRKKPLKRH